MTTRKFSAGTYPLSARDENFFFFRSKAIAYGPRSSNSICILNTFYAYGIYLHTEVRVPLVSPAKTPSRARAHCPLVKRAQRFTPSLTQIEFLFVCIYIYTYNYCNNLIYIYTYYFIACSRWWPFTPSSSLIYIYIYIRTYTYNTPLGSAASLYAYYCTCLYVEE